MAQDTCAYMGTSSSTCMDLSRIGYMHTHSQWSCQCPTEILYCLIILRLYGGEALLRPDWEPQNNLHALYQKALKSANVRLKEDCAFQAIYTAMLAGWHCWRYFSIWMTLFLWGDSNNKPSTSSSLGRLSFLGMLLNNFLLDRTRTTKQSCPTEKSMWMETQRQTNGHAITVGGQKPRLDNSINKDRIA